MSIAAPETYEPLRAARPVRIVGAEVVRPPLMRVRFDDGATREVDFDGVIAANRWFVTLRIPETFADFEIVDEGRALRWISGVDYCADALRIEADRQAAAQFKETM